jgi:hypothetical protein
MVPDINSLLSPVAVEQILHLMNRIEHTKLGCSRHRHHHQDGPSRQASLFDPRLQGL